MWKRFVGTVKALRSLTDVLGETCRLRTIRQKQVDQWAGVLLARGVKPTTINSYLCHVRAALNTAVEWGRVEKPPRLKGQKEPKRLTRALTPEEAEKILALEAN